MDAGEYLTKTLLSLVITLIIILTPYIITRLITHRNIQPKTVKILTTTFSIISFLVFAVILLFSGGDGGVSIIPIVIWNTVGYFIIRPKNVSASKSNSNTYDFDNNDSTEIDMKTIIDNQSLKDYQIKCNHCGNIQNKNIKRCLRCSKIIDTNNINNSSSNHKVEEQKLPAADNKSNSLFSNSSYSFLPKLFVDLLSKNNILTTNVLTLSDTYQFFYNFIAVYITSNPNLNQNEKEYLIKEISENTLFDLTEKFNFNDDIFIKIFKARSEYVDRYFERQIQTILDPNDILMELSNIITYDVYYEKYVEYDETSPLIITGLTESYKYIQAVNQLFTPILSELENLLK